MSFCIKSSKRPDLIIPFQEIAMRVKMHDMVLGVWLHILAVVFPTFGILSHILFGGRYTLKIVKMYGKIVVWSIEHIGGIHIHVSMPEGLKLENVLIISRHESWFDAFFFFTLPGLQVYVMAEWIRKVPIFGWCAVMAGMIVIPDIPNHDARRFFCKELKNGIHKALSIGYSVIMFVEGTRMAPTSNLGKVGGGARRVCEFVRNTGYLVVPCWISAGEVCGRSMWSRYLHGRDVFVTFGNPLEDCSTTTIYERISELRH